MGREQWPQSLPWRIVRSEKHLWGQAECKRSKGKGKRTTLPSRPLAWRWGTGGNWEELGGLTGTHPAPRQQAPPVTPPGGPRADWLKDQPLGLQGDPAPHSSWSPRGLPACPGSHSSGQFWAPGLFSSPRSSASANQPPPPLTTLPPPPPPSRRELRGANRGTAAARGESAQRRADAAARSPPGLRPCRGSRPGAPAARAGAVAVAW